MKHTFLFAITAAVFTNICTTGAQTAVEGYAFEENNRGYLRQVDILILELPEKVVKAELSTDGNGHFSTTLDPGEYRVVAKKDIFFDWDEKITVSNEKVFLKIEMKRKPGYLFDITIAEARESPDVVVDAVEGATIEIFNRTKNKPELVLRQHPNAFFQYTFEQGNHYTMLIRKPGYLAKRIEVYVNIEGCILCVDGVRSLSPGITENLTSNNTTGTLLSNIELERAKIDKRIQIQNIYYDFDKWDIRSDAAERLDNVVNLMRDNPGLSVELGSHTDSRGNDEYNMDLSHKRALSAVAYIISEGIDSARITAKGYGESQLVNRCRNGVPCSEAEHQLNRRTELRITGISSDSLEYLQWPSLDEIINEESPEKKARMKRAKARRDNRLLEANNSTPLPDLKAEAAGSIEESSDEAPPELMASPQFETAAIIAPPGNRLAADATPVPDTPALSIALLQLPDKFSGFSIEVATADTLWAQIDSSMSTDFDIYWLQKPDGKYTYFTGNFESAAAARGYYYKNVERRLPKARLVRFNKGKKTYFK
ncbi:MAG: OmpA family protein [Saprospiraceae bacterium]|nr:OmpA family protein [Saprospiraceae bacterium]